MNQHGEEHQVVVASVREALFALMEKKEYSGITVCELCRKAGIARSTFYRNYDSKDSVLRASMQDVFLEFDRQYFPETLDDRYKEKYIREVTEYVARYQKRLKCISRANLSNIYLEEFNRHLLNTYRRGLEHQDKIRIYSVAGAQYNLIFNLSMKNQT
ncbi:MAG TPA: TetR/AcrR family transcriptional regulator [Lachnospiraceae bacterium]|nr:TetR/AcrR family transcriptional regulator [Lachnospiraceae bacterium]